MKKPLLTLQYLLSVHISALIILTVFRCILYIANMHYVNDVDDKLSLFGGAILKGVQFDNVMACYIVALPVAVLTIMSLFNKVPAAVIKGFNIYFIILYTIVFAFSAADIPYFKYYFMHMGASIFNWIGFEGTAGMIFQESSYYIYFAVFIILSFLFSAMVMSIGKRLLKKQAANLTKKDYKFYIPVVILVWGLCFLGIRGTFERYPLRVGDAYFCNNSFFNQLGVNPAFYFVKSSSAFFKKNNKLAGTIDQKDAILFVQKEFNIDTKIDSNPISRLVKTEGAPKDANVIIILMESMSSENLDTEYQGNKLMPYLNDLIDKSYYFENFYSSGIHTNNGIASTLYGFPPIFDQTMMSADVDFYTGLPINLKEQGYQTLFFLTSNPQYDNMNSFLLENGFDRIFSQYDYPKEKVVNNFGVQDDYLFEYGLNKLSNIAEQKKPFLATFMTVSNHPPYVIPKQFMDAGKNDAESILRFADHSLQDFMINAAKQEWYDNTIFVILGDHGKPSDKQPYEMCMGYNHVPLIIYSPLFDDMPKRFEQFGGQIDIFPTVMGLLNRPYINNSLGVDLFKTERPYMYFVSDSHLGCVDNNFFYIYNPATKTDALHKYRNIEEENLIQQYPNVADSMKNYSISMMLTADYLVKNKLTGPNSKQ
ncbi:LTA synthase family protein [Dysgonomonas sp. ZJ709]|uniref:LTA synthase family protein n=1 Tax=Dysgonomonas sp. ZJ709 TaxID=2709797 RepID=UPI0013EE3BD4|nr:alkaline phosphatase family protein [Dysgonomonas sp. ZJ709]